MTMIRSGLRSLFQFDFEDEYYEDDEDEPLNDHGIFSISDDEEDEEEEGANQEEQGQNNAVRARWYF